MLRADHTLNAWDSHFWMQVPLPVAQVGSQLDAGRDDYFEALLKVAEDAIAVAGAIGLAQARHHWSVDRAKEAAAYLHQPSLGKRAQLVWALEEVSPGSTGWSADDPAGDLADFIRLVNPGSVPREPRVRHVMGAMATLRNDAHHRRLAASRQPDSAALLENAVFRLIQRNRRFYEHMLWIERVQLRSDGRRELTAHSLNGAMAKPYRRGHWQVTTDDVMPKRVYLGEPGDLLELHPFIVAAAGRVYVLDELRSNRPVLRHFAGREKLEADLTGDFDRIWPARQPAPERVGGSAGPTPAGVDAHAATIIDDPAPAPGRRRLALPLQLILGAGGCAALLVGAAVVTALTMFGASEQEHPVPSSAAVHPSQPETDSCPRPVPPGAAIEHALPSIMTGAPLSWGSGRDTVESACGPLTNEPAPTCLRPFATFGATRWASNLSIPRPRTTVLAFHHRRGFFEAMVYSDASVSELSAAVEARLGPPHRLEGTRRFWDYPPGGQARARVKVVGLRAADSRGRSAIKLNRLDVSEEYRRELEAADCR